MARMWTTIFLLAGLSLRTLSLPPMVPPTALPG